MAGLGTALQAGVPRPTVEVSLRVVDSSSGLRLMVAQDNTCPTLTLGLPASQVTSGSIMILFPEHVTVVEHAQTEPKHLYLWRPGRACNPPHWGQDGRSLEYQMDLVDDVHMLARATLDSDGVRYQLEFINDSNVGYDSIQAIWDPRMYKSTFRDVRLERTYVHRLGGWELLASDMPSRLTMPLNQWLPCRYRDSYTWPVFPSGKRIRKDEDGITIYDASRRVDLPVIATLSQNRKWVAATFTKACGNVWTNPEITCQHANPEEALKAGGRASLDGKTFVFEGSLDKLREKVVLECRRRAP